MILQSFMREISFPLTSLGSSALENPDIKDAAKFVSSVKGNTADRITYELYAGIMVQKPFAAEAAAGGDFYQPRIEEFLGAVDGSLKQEPAIATETISADLSAVKIKGLGFSLPAFSELSLKDEYLDDADEFEAAGVEAYKRLSRELRDAGAIRTILLGENPGELELEGLRGRKYVWKANADSYERVLEYSRDLVIASSDVGRLADLFESYDMRYLYLLDAEREGILTALKYFDKEYVFVAGYAVGDEREEYWKGLSELKVRVEE